MDVNLLLVRKDGSHKKIPMPSSVTVLGRRRNCDLRIPVVSVSRKHCQLNYENGVLKLRDLNSRNGTTVNGKDVQEAEVNPGDVVRIGPVTFVMQIDGNPGKPGSAESKPTKPISAPAEAPPDDSELFAEFPELDDLDEEL